MIGRRFLESLANYIQANPDVYRQVDSEHCIYGIAKHRAGDTDPGRHLRIATKLNALLGGKDRQFHNLVCSYWTWPERFRQAFLEADTREDKARVAVRLVRFIARNGVPAR
jgi:hypothetical protein